LDLDMNEKAQKARVKSLLKIWIKSKALKIERVHSTRDGRAKPTVVVGAR
jgi:hypothetical protein